MSRGLLQYAIAIIGGIALASIMAWLIQNALIQNKYADIWKEMRGLVDPYYYGKVLDLYVSTASNDLEEDFVEEYLSIGGKMGSHGGVDYDGEVISVKEGDLNKDRWGEVMTRVLNSEIWNLYSAGSLIFAYLGNGTKYAVLFKPASSVFGLEFLSIYNFTSTYKPPELEDAFKDGEKIAELKIDVDGDGKEEDVYICRAEYEYNGKTYNATYAKVGGC